jgi:hypothetical protein
LNNTVNCFSDVENKRTCDPIYRSPFASGCQDQFISYCVKDGTKAGNPGSYTTKWLSNESKCVQALDVNYKANNPYAAKLLGALLNQYFIVDGFQPTTPGNTGYNSFQERLAVLSKTYPSAANSFLNQTLCSAFSRGDLSNNLGRITFCGCHLPADQYATTQSIGVSSIACDSLCSNTQAIPTVNGAGTTERCTQGVCVIDNVTIGLINTSVGTISINQVCNGCDGGGCSCSIVNVNLNANNSTLDKIDFGQNCQSPACYTTSSTGETNRVDCTLTPNEQQDQSNNESETRRQERIQQSTNRTVRLILIILSVTIVLLLIIAIIIFILSKKKDAM